MWKPAAAVIMTWRERRLTRNSNNHQLRIDKTISELAQEGYEIKAAEGLSGDIPKFVLQKAHSIIVCQINFSIGEENCFQLRSRRR